MMYFVPLIWAAVAQAQTPPPAPPVRERPAPRVVPVDPANKELTPPKKRHALILCGHPGDAEHEKSFTETVRKLGDGLANTLGIPPERQYILFGADRPKDLPGATGPATREAVAAKIAEVRKAVQPEDGLWVICLGHCHHDGRQAWWNLPGPDINAAAFGKLFADLSCREQVFVMTTSLSGFFVAPLSRPGRVVIAATEADAETNETTFPHVLAQFLANGLKLADHDVDKDGKLSLFDLYVVVAKEIAQNYASAEQLATEHQQLDDDGDRVGHELQSAYLPEEQGGAPPGKKKNPPRHRDGRLAALILLSLSK
ncbi:MAG TPA: hypothetical protein VMG10_03925 [Gemmataceae bacterium]|nr:hypothetical protein [Gemmataceae bacterium]